jgi:hypothetical protein
VSPVQASQQQRNEHENETKDKRGVKKEGTGAQERNQNAVQKDEIPAQTHGSKYDKT